MHHAFRWRCIECLVWEASCISVQFHPASRVRYTLHLIRSRMHLEEDASCASFKMHHWPRRRYIRHLGKDALCTNCKMHHGNRVRCIMQIVQDASCKSCEMHHANRIRWIMKIVWDASCTFHKINNAHRVRRTRSPSYMHQRQTLFTSCKRCFNVLRPPIHSSQDFCQPSNLAEPDWLLASAVTRFPTITVVSAL